MFRNEYSYQHDYVRLALDTGFTFEKRQSGDWDKNKISLLNIEQIIEERDIGVVERLIPHIIHFVLDSEEIQLLDSVFVKTFCLSQLAIQYLLFCKKYLDNTVALLKKQIKALKEEAKDSEQFVEDLQSHISELMKGLENKPTFRCQNCEKVFSTQDFLDSHVKRRHSSVPEVQKIETDKLHLEIKELKERLNSAERKIKKEEQDDCNKDFNSGKIDELMVKFEDLRVEVQGELKKLQAEHRFEEKYDKLYEEFLLKRNERMIDEGGGDLSRRRESTTQTEIEEVIISDEKKIEEEACKADHLAGFEDTQKQITEFGEALESKVTTSLEKIESQMQSFWKKLNEIETVNTNRNECETKAVINKPSVKPRSRLTISTNLESSGELTKVISPVRSQKDEEDTKNLKITVVQKSITSRKEPINTKSLVSESELSSEDNDVAILETKEENKDQQKILNKEILRQFRNEVEKIIEERLASMGVSVHWTGIPEQSYVKAQEIINHQAGLMRKVHKNYNKIRAQIERNIATELNLSPSKKLEPKQRNGRKLEIKNRSIYETDSDNEDRIMKASLGKLPEYTAVVEELKITQMGKKYQRTEKEETPIQINRGMYDTDSENEPKVVKTHTGIEQLKMSEISEAKSEETKGVLKNYGSVGALNKKKVLFNLDNESSTSVASSVLDGTPRRLEKKEELEDLSDFDLS